jgi:hypothetical protein
MADAERVLTRSPTNPTRREARPDASSTSADGRDVHRYVLGNGRADGTATPPKLAEATAMFSPAGPAATMAAWAENAVTG